MPPQIYYRRRPVPGVGFLPGLPDVGAWLDILSALSWELSAVGRSGLFNEPAQLDLPTPPAPAAPLTQNQATRPGAWTPAEMMATTFREYDRWRQGFGQGTQAVQQPIVGPAPARDWTDLWPIYVAAGLGAVALVILIRK